VRSSAAPGLGGRGEPCSGEQAGRLGKCAGRQAQGGRGEGLEELSRHGIEAEHRAHQGGTHGGAAAGSASREGRPGDPFMVGIGGGEELLLRSKAQTAAWARHGLGGRRRAADGAASGGSACSRRRVRTCRVAPAYDL
jgi:hypothetical protein